MTYADLVNMLQAAVSDGRPFSIKVRAGRDRSRAVDVTDPVQVAASPAAPVTDPATGEVLGEMVRPWAMEDTAQRLWRVGERQARELRTWIEWWPRGANHPADWIEVARPAGSELVPSTAGGATPATTGADAILHETAIMLRDLASINLAQNQVIVSLTRDNAQHEGREVVAGLLGEAVQKVSELESKERIMDKVFSKIEGAFTAHPAILPTVLGYLALKVKAMAEDDAERTEFDKWKKAKKKAKKKAAKRAAAEAAAKAAAAAPVDAGSAAQDTEQASSS